METVSRTGRAATRKGDDVIYLRAENSKTRKPDTMPLEGELLEIIERRRAAAVLQAEDGERRAEDSDAPRARGGAETVETAVPTRIRRT